MGEGASGGGGGGGSEDRRSTSAPSARPVQRPTQRPSAAAPAPRSGGRGDPRQFGFDPAAAAASRAPRPPNLTPGVDVAALPPRLPESRTFSPPTPRVPSTPRDIFVDEFPAGMNGLPVPASPPPMTGAQRRAALDRFSGNVADSMDFLLGPTGIPNRLRAVNQMLNPVVAIEDAMVQSGRAADPTLPVGERVRAGGSAALTTALFGIPSALAARGFIPTTTAVGETLLGISSAPRDVVLGPLDIRNRIAADEFMAQYPGDELGLFEGAYIPKRAQNVDLLQRGQTGNLSPTEQQYIEAMYEADQLTSQGLSPRQVYERTGILSVPNRTIAGDVSVDSSYGPRLSFTTTPVRGNRFTSTIDRNAVNEVFDQNRQARLRDLMLLPENLRGGMIPPRRTTVEAKDMGPTTYGGASRLNDSITLNTAPAARARADDVLRHEAAHTYLYESNIPPGAAGANPDRIATEAREGLAALRSEVAAAEKDYSAGLIDAVQLQEIRNAAAAQRVALLRSPFELYSENLGEVIARRAGREPNQNVTVGLGEAFNPYIPTSSGVIAGRTLLENFRGAARAPIEQGIFNLRQVFERPSADNSGPFNQSGIVARVPANIFERARTDSRPPVYVPRRAPVPAGFPDPFANVSNNEFDFDAFD